LIDRNSAMNDVVDLPDEAALRRALPQGSRDLSAVLCGGLDAGALTLNDLQTLRDWLETTGQLDREPLMLALACLFAALAEGSLCVELSAQALAARLDEWCAGSGDAWAARILAELEGSLPCPKLIGTAATDARPVILHTAGSRRYLYFQRYLRAEEDLVARLEPRLGRAAQHDDAWAPIFQDVLVDAPLRLHGQALELDPDQRAGLNLALNRSFTIISGGPGTGKTSIILTLLRCLVRRGIPAGRLALAAPTGRAAQRLSDALRAGLASLPTPHAQPDQALQAVSAATLHHLLSFVPGLGLFRRHAENPLEADVVIVDEASMVSLDLWARLLEATPPEAKLILLGDKDQLPSVEAGAVLSMLVPSDRSARSGEVGADKHFALLRINHRSQAGIRAAAQAINVQDASVLERLPVAPAPRADAEPSLWHDLDVAGGCWLCRCGRGSEAELRRLLDHWARRSFLAPSDGITFPQLLQRCTLEGAGAETPATADHLRALFARLERARLLTMLREGPWGSEAINRFFEQQLRPRFGAPGQGRLFVGAPVLITRNDPGRRLYNGDLGLAIRSRLGLRVAFARQDGFVSIPADVLPPHELGFALTVHKSQGSEYDEVLVILPPRGGRRLLTKELLYTAITRARKLAVIAATDEALRCAIGRRVDRDAALLHRAAGVDLACGLAAQAPQNR
jgi:exodeoxyribonuclease V alpha subunit